MIHHIHAFTILSGFTIDYISTTYNIVASFLGAIFHGSTRYDSVVSCVFNRLCSQLSLKIVRLGWSLLLKCANALETRQVKGLAFTLGAAARFSSWRSSL